MRRSLRRFNHYQTLGIGFRATSSEIKSSFRELAKKYHPDQNPGDEQAEQKFRQIKEAYECLSNKLRRAEYDRDWVKTGRVRWEKSSESSTPGSTNEQGLSKGQLILLYAGTIGLPFLASLLRSNQPYQGRDSIETSQTGWSQIPPMPSVSPRDELTRAFYNPLTRQWERLGERNNPPTPLELFKHFVKEHRAAYKHSLKSNNLSIPSADEAFTVYEVPSRITKEPLMAVDTETQTIIFASSS